MKEVGRAIVIGIDAMVPKLIEIFSKEGRMPNLIEVKKKGVFSEVIPTLPPVTPPGWAAIATGAPPSTTGIEGFEIHKEGEYFTKEHDGVLSTACKAEFLWNVAERVGKRPFILKYPVSWPPTIQNGIQVGGKGGWGSQTCPFFITEPSCFFAGEPPRKLKYAQKVNLSSPANWTYLPVNKEVVSEAKIAIGIRDGGKKEYYLLILKDSNTQEVALAKSKDYREVLAVASSSKRTAWAHDTYDIHQDTKEGAFDIRLVHFSPDGKDIQLYIGPAHQITGFTVPQNLAKDLYQKIGPYTEWISSSNYHWGWVNDEVQMDMYEDHTRWLTETFSYITNKYGWDLCFLQWHCLDYAQHIYWGGINPRYSYHDENKREKYLGLLGQVYQLMDRFVGDIMRLIDENCLVIVVGDHGTDLYGMRFDVNNLLAKKGLLSLEWNSETRQATINWSKTKAYAFSHQYIFINRKGRDPEGIVKDSEYEKLREEVIEMLYEVKDLKTNNHPIQIACKKEDLTPFGIYGGGVGDIVYSMAPGYSSGRGGMPHEYQDYLSEVTPELELFKRNILLEDPTGGHGSFFPFSEGVRTCLFAQGPGIKRNYETRIPVQLIDIAPTIAFAMGMPFPRNCEGSVLFDICNDDLKNRLFS